MRTFAVATLIAVSLASPSLAADAAPITRVTKTHWPKLFAIYSPDGSHFLYSRHYPNRRASQQILTGLRVVRVDGSNDRTLMPEFDRTVQIQEHPAFGLDRVNTLYVTGGGNDVGNSAKDTFLCELTDDYRGINLKKLVPGSGITVGEMPTPSPDGKQLAFCSYGKYLYLADITGKNRKSLVQTAGSYLYQPAWSPDGEWLAFACDRDGDVELYKIRPDGTELTRLTRSPGVDCRPRWSPDAQWVLFTSNRSGNEDLYLMKANGSDVRRLTDHAAPDDHGCWSPDGQRIAFVSMRDGGFDLYTMPLPSGVLVAKAPPAKPAPKPVGDLAAHYDFDDDEGTAPLDRVTGRTKMALTGARLVGAKGKKAISFDGKGHFASAGNTADLHIDGAITFTVWVKPTKVESNGYLLSKYAWNLYLGSDFIPRFETRSGGDKEWETLAALVHAEPGKWTQIACVFDPARKEKQIYVNAKLSAVTSRAEAKLGGAQSYNFELGHYVAGRSQQYYGLMDEVRVYRKALDGKQIAEEFKKQRAKVNGS